MFEGFRSLLLGFLRVPPEPAAPEGASIRVFRASPAFFRYRLVLWGVGQLTTLVGLIGGVLALAHFGQFVDQSLLRLGLRAAEAFAWIAFLFQIPFTYALLRLDYDMRWYILSDRSLRIRDGILTVREKTMTFANIQQISIEQNPLQRLLGIMDIKVRTAGGGAGGGDKTKGEAGKSLHEAYFRGVADGEEIRAAIQARVRFHRDSGLGDPDEPQPPALPADGDPTMKNPAVAAARAVLSEVRALRQTLTKSARN